MSASREFSKHADSKLDFKFDWAPLTNGTPGGVSDWLASGDTISTHVVTADSGITVDSSNLADSNTSVVVWLSGGAVGISYVITCSIVTAQGREDSREIVVTVC